MPASKPATRWPSNFQAPLPRPEVSLKLRGQKAGVAHLHQNLLRFNEQLYRENTEPSCARPWLMRSRTGGTSDVRRTIQPTVRNGN